MWFRTTPPAVYEPKKGPREKPRQADASHFDPLGADSREAPQPTLIRAASAGTNNACVEAARSALPSGDSFLRDSRKPSLHSDYLSIEQARVPSRYCLGSRDKHSEQAKKKGVWFRTTPLFRHCSPAARQSAYSLCRNSANSFSSDARRSTDSGTWMRTFARPSASKLNVAAFLFLTVNVWGFAST